jgi:hypothetical protein
MRRHVATNAKAMAVKARQAQGARREAERIRQAEADKIRQAEAVKKAENLARVGIPAGLKNLHTNPLLNPPAASTSSPLPVTGDPPNIHLQPSLTSLAPGTIPLTANPDEQQAPNTNKTQPLLDPDILPEDTSTKITIPGPAPSTQKTSRTSNKKMEQAQTHKIPRYLAAKNSKQTTRRERSTPSVPRAGETTQTQPCERQPIRAPHTLSTDLLSIARHHPPAPHHKKT